MTYGERLELERLDQEIARSEAELKMLGAEINQCGSDFTRLADLTKQQEAVQQKLDENEKYDLNSTMIFHGIGDRGGAPKEASVAFVEQEINKNKDSNVQVLASGADDLFRDLNAQLTPEQKAKLPRWETELVMQNHGVGGYTSRAVGKRWNRRCQELADMAERSGVVADYLGTAGHLRAARLSPQLERLRYGHERLCR